MEPEIIGYLQSWADELNARANRVRQLIGDKHWLSDGHHKEYILREFLERHLSPEVQVARGFILPPDPENPISGEVDLLVSSFRPSPPWFNEGGMMILPPASVFAQIHVKTAFSGVQVADVFLSTAAAFRSVQKYLDPKGIWAGAFFFDPKEATGALRLNVSNWIGSFVRDFPATLQPNLFPNCIAVRSGTVLFFDRSGATADRQISVRAFDCGELAPAVLFADMFEHSGAAVGQPRGALTNILERVEMKPLFKASFEFKPRRKRDRKVAKQ